MLAWNPGVLPLTLQLSVLMIAGLCAPVLWWDPRTVRPEVAPFLFPGGFSAAKFAVGAVFGVFVHVPLEELYWRGAAMPEGRPGALWGSAVFFYLMHALPLAVFLGVRGWSIALPTAIAGWLWAQSALDSKSLWPAILSHMAVDTVLLYGVWRYFA